MQRKYEEVVPLGVTQWTLNAESTLAQPKRKSEISGSVNAVNDFQVGSQSERVC